MQVARDRESGQQLEDNAADFGISESCLTNWMKASDVEAGAPAWDELCPRTASLRQAKKRIRVLVQEKRSVIAVGSDVRVTCYSQSMTPAWPRL